MRHIDWEAVRIETNVLRFFERAKTDGYSTFTINGHELIEGDYMDGWAIRIYGETIPLHIHFCYVEQGKGEFKARFGMVRMPAISASGKWLEDGGFYFENTYTMEGSYKHLVLKSRRKRKGDLPLDKGEVPSIYITGKWLINHGFWVGQIAKIAVYPSKIIVSSIRDLPHDPNSFLRWQKAHGRRGIEYFPIYYQSLSYEQKKGLSR
jgi:hypothetical protein